MLVCARYFVILFAVVLFAGCVTASRNRVQIDDLLSFTEVEVTPTVKSAIKTQSEVGSEQILGDIRKLYMSTNGTGSTRGDANVQNGKWSTSTNTPRAGEGFVSSLIYDGGSGNIQLIIDKEGLFPKQNLRLGNAYGFKYTVKTDQTIVFVITVYTDANRYSEATISIPPTSPNEVTGYLLYDEDFDISGPGGPADFTQVGALAFAKIFVSAATDASLSFINAFAEYVTGKVYLDCNQQLCTYDSADTLLPNYSVSLTREGENTPLQTTVTNSAGVYEFYMSSGVYQVCLVSLGGFQLASCNQQCRRVDVSTPNSPDQLDYDFALTTSFTITPPPDRTLECNKNGVTTTTTVLGTATVNACGGNPVATFSDSTSLLCGPESSAYSIIRTFVATQNGQTISATQIIQVTDTINPVISPVADASVTCQACTTTACLGSPVVTDQCTNNNFLTPALSTSNPTGGCVSTFTRTWSFTDPCGRSATAVTQLITIRDTGRPSITAPQSTTVNCGQSGSFGEPQVSDDCNTPTVRTFDQDSSVGCNRVITRFFTADDGCGNTAVTSATITSPSAGSPILTVPDDLDVTCQSSLTPTALNSFATAVDSCVGGSLPVSFRDSGSFSSSSPPYNLGGSCTASFIRTWSVSDACAGSQSGQQVITISDNVNPAFTSVVSPVTGGCSGPVNGVAPLPTDTCNPSSSVTVTFSDSNPQGDSCTTTVTRTYLATDPCGNQASTSQLLVRTDSTPPNIFLPTTSYSVECPASTSPDASNTATASDNCQPSNNIQLTFSDVSDGSSACVSTFRRTWYANDGCATPATAVQTVRSVDNTPPFITGPSSITVPCTQVATSTTTSNSGTPTVSDTCSPNGVTVTFADISTNGALCPDGIIITRRFTAIDACGLRSTSDQFITITKDSLPSISVTPSSVEVECDNPNTSPNALATTSTSNSCDVGLSLSVVDSPIPTVGCRRTFTRTFTVRDLCGDEASASQVITIVDSVPPTIIAPGPTTILCTDDLDNTDTGSAVVTDNCETGLNQQVVRTQNDVTGQPTDGTCPGDTIRTVTFTVTDSCGNTVSATQQITIETRPIGECIPVDCTPVACNTDSCPQADCECCGAAATPCSPVNCSPALCNAVDCSPVPCSGCTGSNGNSGCQPRACPPTYVYVNDDDIQGFGKMQEQQTTINPKVSGASQLVISCLLIAATFSSIFVALF